MSAGLFWLEICAISIINRVIKSFFRCDFIAKVVYYKVTFRSVKCIYAFFIFQRLTEAVIPASYISFNNEVFAFSANGELFFVSFFIFF